MITPSVRKACLVLAAAATLLVPTNAFAADSPPLEAGDIAADSYVVGSGAITLLDLEFVATKNEGKPAEGTFEGTDPFGSRFAGKVTCLQFEGAEKAAFIVVPDDTSTSAFYSGAQLVTVKDNGAGATGSFGLQSVAADAKTCAPGDASMKANDGNVTIVPKNKGAK